MHVSPVCKEIRQGQMGTLERRPGPLLLPWACCYSCPYSLSTREACRSSGAHALCPGVTPDLGRFCPVLLFQGFGAMFCLFDLLQGRVRLCVSLTGKPFPGLPPPVGAGLLSQVPHVPIPHLLPVQPGAEAGLAYCLRHSLLTAVPSLCGHEHADVALRLFRGPFSRQGLQSWEDWRENHQDCPALGRGALQRSSFPVLTGAVAGVGVVGVG